MNKYKQSCFHCCLKHIAQAAILYEESLMGYPLHIYLSKGHLAEAASEVMREDIELSQIIRRVRLDMDNGVMPDFLFLIEETEKRSGKDTSH